MPAQPPILTPSQLSQLLKAARRMRRYTQADLSQRVGVGQSRVSSLELNAASMTVEQLLAWCAALGLELTLQARETAPTASPAVAQPPSEGAAPAPATRPAAGAAASSRRTAPRSDDGAW